jgi:hypothetical protein
VRKRKYEKFNGYLKQTKDDFQTIKSSRDIYASIREANRLLRRIKDLENGVSWNESLTGWPWVKRKIVELLEYIGFELLLVLRKALFGIAVLVGWILVLGLVIVWLRGFQ